MWWNTMQYSACLTVLYKYWPKRSLVDNFLLVWVGKTPGLWLQLECCCSKYDSNFINQGHSVHNHSWAHRFAFPGGVSRRVHHRPFNSSPVFRATFLRLSPTVGSLRAQVPKPWILHVWLHVLHVLPPQSMCITSFLLPAWLIRCVARADQLDGMTLITPLGRLNYFPSCVQWGGRVFDTLSLQGDDRAKYLVLGVLDGWIMQKFGDGISKIFSRGTDV